MSIKHLMPWVLVAGISLLGPLTAKGQDLFDPFAPAELGPVRLRNRIIKAATSEGRSHYGHVTDDLIEFLVAHPPKVRDLRNRPERQVERRMASRDRVR